MIRTHGAGIRARALNRPMELVVGRLGVPVPGVRVLRVHGRRSGRLRTVPLMVVRAGGARYLVAPRGEGDWTRNLRAAGWGELMRGRDVERVRAVPVDGAERERAVGAYLRRYGWLTRSLFGVGRAPSAEEVRAVAGTRPVFRLEVMRAG